MKIAIVALLVPEDEIFDASHLKQLYQYFDLEDVRPDRVASSHFVGALRAALEIQSTFNVGSTIEPLPDISNSAHRYNTPADGPIAIRKALEIFSKEKIRRGNRNRVLVVVSESKTKLTHAYTMIGKETDTLRPAPDLSPGDIIVMKFERGELRKLFFQTKETPFGAP